MTVGAARPSEQRADRDARLADLLDAAERELPCPNVVHLLTGSWLIQGKPASTRQFLQRTHDSIYNSFANTKDARKFRGSRQELTEKILNETRPIMGSLEGSSMVDQVTLNLIDATIMSSVGPSLHPPAIRVPISSIAAWWIADFEVNNTGGGSAVGFGVAF